MGEGETTQPNIQLRRLGPPHTGRHFIQAMKIPCNWLISHCGLINDTAADVDDEEEVVEPHIADHCHRSHKPVCDPGPGRGDPAKPFLRRSLCRVAWNRVSTALLLFGAGLVPKSGPANHAEIYGRAAPHRGFNLFQHRSVSETRSWCSAAKAQSAIFCTFAHFVPAFRAAFATRAHVSDSAAACSNY